MYRPSVIRSFRCRETRTVFEGEFSRKFQNIANSAAKKLWVLHTVKGPEDLASYPGYRLERLKGDRAGQYSIRINDQYRICFTWKEGSAHDVEIVDYH